MPKFRVYVSDTITYERSHVAEIEAEDATVACEKAIALASDGAFHDKWEECEIDNTPYDAVLADPSEDGTSGQDRESYSDDQDRDSYTV